MCVSVYVCVCGVCVCTPVCVHVYTSVLACVYKSACVSHRLML
jgi:hypothetical protein